MQVCAVSRRDRRSTFFCSYWSRLRADSIRESRVSDHPAKERKGQASRGRVEADAASQSEIGSLSDLQFVVHADSKAPEKTAASAGPSQGDLSRTRWAAGVAGCHWSYSTSGLRRGRTDCCDPLLQNFNFGFPIARHQAHAREAR
jgi:hypothetical protein